MPDRPPASEARPKARRAGARPYRSGRRGRQRSRGQIALLAGGLTVVLVAVAAATVLVTTPAPAPGHAVQVRTLARVQAVSSVAQGFGARWYTDDSAGTLTRLDPADGRAAGSVSVAGRPTAVITAFGSLWVASTVTNTVEEISPQALRVERTVAVAAGPSSLCAADGRVWVTSVLSGTLTSIDPSAGAVAGTRVLAAGAVRVAAGDRALWVSGSTDRVSRVGLGAEGAMEDVRSVPVGNAPLGVAAGGDRVWVAVSGAGRAVALNPRTLAAVASVHTGPDPVSVAVTGALAWVVDGQAGTVTTVRGDGVLGHASLAGAARQVVASGSSGALVAVADPGAIRVATTR